MAHTQTGSCKTKKISTFYDPVYFNASRSSALAHDRAILTSRRITHLMPFTTGAISWGFTKISDEGYVPFHVVTRSPMLSISILLPSQRPGNDG